MTGTQSIDKKEFAARAETIGNVPNASPMTGNEYLASLDDGREVYIYGERVEESHGAPGLPQHGAHGGAAL